MIARTGNSGLQLRARRGRGLPPWPEPQNPARRARMQLLHLEGYNHALWGPPGQAGRDEDRGLEVDCVLVWHPNR